MMKSSQYWEGRKLISPVHSPTLYAIDPVQCCQEAKWNSVQTSLSSLDRSGVVNMRQSDSQRAWQTLPACMDSDPSWSQGKDLASTED